MKYPNNKIEILIKADNLLQFDTNTKEVVIDLILTNLLGERRKMEEIDFADLMGDYDCEDGITPLYFLPANLDKIRNGTQQK